MISDRYPKCDATKGRSDPGIPGHKRTNSDAPQKAFDDPREQRISELEAGRARFYSG